MDEYTKDLYTMMFSLQTLQNQGITIRETVYKSLDKLLLWNKESEIHSGKPERMGGSGR